MVVCHRMCDNHHYHLEEEERPTTMVTTTGDKAQGEGCHYDSMTGSTAMVTTMQDRLQERSSLKRPTTSLDYVIRLTDRLRCFGTKISGFFSQIWTLVALWPAILRFAAALAALILRLRPAGCDLGSAKLHKYRGGLALRFPNRSGLRPVAI